MRDLLFRNLISEDKKRRIVATSEISDSHGVRSIIRRHFICLLKQVNVNDMHKPLTHIYVTKEHNTKEDTGRFFCKLKGSVYVLDNGRLFMAFFSHSLKIKVSHAIKTH